MTDKEKLDQLGEVDQKDGSELYEKKEEIAQVLGKEVRPEDIPSSFKSWKCSVSGQGSLQDSKFIYGESMKDVVGAVLVDYSYYPGGGCGMEYGVKIFVKRGDKKDMEKIVYRDSYSASRDDRSKAFKRIDKVEVKDDKVVVTVSSSERTSNYSFYLKKPEDVVDEQILTAEQQQKFKERIAQEKERLLKQETRELGIMPSTYDLVYMQMPNPQLFDKKYDKAEIIDEVVDLGKGECYIMIKTQIDAHADCGKQYAWLKYKITPTTTELVAQESAYQSELMSGKEIKIRI